MSTTRTPEQLDAFRGTVIEKARRIRSGDFTATPDSGAAAAASTG